MTPLVVPVWGVQAGVLTTWVVYNITVGTGTLAGSGIELLGTAVGSLALGPVAGIACQAISRQAKHHVIHASETTALIAGSVAGLGVTAGLTVGRWLCVESIIVANHLLELQKQQEQQQEQQEQQEQEIMKLLDIDTESEEDYVLVGLKEYCETDPTDDHTSTDIYNVIQES